MTKTIPKKKKCKKVKYLSEETLQIAEKRREVKGKGASERHTQLNAEFQRKARRNKKAFLREQCKDIEENNEWERLASCIVGKARKFHIQIDKWPVTP